MEPLRPWTVMVNGAAEVVLARPWLVALGLYLEQRGETTGRLATETLPNGVVLVHDMAQARRLVVMEGLLARVTEEETEELPVPC